MCSQCVAVVHVCIRLKVHVCSCALDEGVCVCSAECVHPVFENELGCMCATIPMIECNKIAPLYCTDHRSSNGNYI